MARRRRKPAARPQGSPRPQSRSSPQGRRRKRSRKNRSAHIRRQARRRRVARLIYRFICLLVLLGAGALALTVFFKVDTVRVEGDTRYSADELRRTLAVEQGDSLFFWGKAEGIHRLAAQYPYLDEVRVQRKLPDTLVIRVTECVPCAAIRSGEQYYLMDKKGKLLEQVGAAGADGLPTVTGISLGDAQIGQTIGEKDDEGRLQLFTLLDGLTEAGLMAEVDFINMESLSDIHIGYQERFDVQLGAITDLARKLRFLQTLVTDRLSPSDTGTIDLTDETRARFRPGAVQQPDTGTTDQPGTGTDDQPDTGTDDQPGTGTTDQPDTGTTDQPDISTDDEPGGDGEPVTAA